MFQLKKAVRDICFVTIFLFSLTAGFWLENQYLVFFVTYFSIFFIAFLTRKRREVWPILLIVVSLITAEILIGLSITEPVVFCLVISLIDLIIAFSIVHYHREPFLLKLCKAGNSSRHVPQVYLLSFVLALSSLYSFLLGSEMVFVEFDPKFFGGEQSFFLSLYMPVKMTLKFLFDLIIWSLVLEPTRWKFLRKLENYFYS